MSKRILGAAVAAGLFGCLAVGASPAQAGLLLELSSGTSTVSIPDATSTPGVDMNAQPGMIQYFGTVGDFTVSISGGYSNSIAANSNGILQVSSFDVRSNVGSQQTLKVVLSDVGFTIPSGPAQLYSDSGLTLTNVSAGDSVTFESWADPSNLGGKVVSSGLTTYTVTTASVSPLNFSGHAANSFTNTGTYSMINEANITLSANAQANFVGTTMAVPEPATASLAAAVAGLLLMRRRHAH